MIELRGVDVGLSRDLVGLWRTTFEEAYRAVHLVKHNECPVPLNGGASELKQIYVLASEYGSGVGKLLFNDALQCMQDAGATWIWLSVSDLNQRAQSFYRKLAFKPLGIGPVFEVGSDRLTSTIMGRKVMEK